MHAGCSEIVIDTSVEQARDERHLVYTRADAVWIADADGRHARRLVRGRAPLISPDGRRVLFRRGTLLRLVRSDGSGQRVVTRRIDPLAWVPDSRRVLALRDRSLVTLDVESGRVAIVDRMQSDALYGWSFSPDGRSLAYAHAPRATRWAVCGDRMDLYVVELNGGRRKRITRNGGSAYPVWGRARIAFSRFRYGPGLSGDEAVRSGACFSPGVWTVRPDGTATKPLVGRAPRHLSRSGYYGLRPYAWMSGERSLVIGIRSEWGDETATLDAGTGKITRVDLDRRPRARAPAYVDDVSRDGRYVVGAACGAELPCSILIAPVRGGRHRLVAHGRVGSPDWNR